MGFYRHIEQANNADLSDFVPYFWRDRQIGWIRKDRIDLLKSWPSAFSVIGDRVVLSADRDDYQVRSNCLMEAMNALRDQGVIQGWRDEIYPLVEQFNQPPIAQLERAVCPFLGIRSWGVHMTGYVQKSDGLFLWVAKRANSKPTYPGMLDNMVAGGQPMGLSPFENMQKECWEEAGIPPDLSKNLKPVGAISYFHQLDEGLKPDQIFLYDLELPENFEPVPTDGEVESFSLLPIKEVVDLVKKTDQVKYNCNLVFIDFFIRHGVITPENEPDYMKLCLGLRKSL